MNSNFFLFRFYLIISLFFLIPLATFITSQIYSILEVSLKIYVLTSSFEKNLSCIMKNNIYTNLCNLYLAEGKWLNVIGLSELLLGLHLINKDILYGSLGSCYQSNSFYRIAEYYYLKALHTSPENLNVLLSLWQTYKYLGDDERASKLYTQIQKLNS
uniref:Uncharacterized protein n=1 Tax=Alsidium seaforthii TaxID=2007182 RepID=A0A1Z1MDE2_9FLOR|nr:hypothetical protein [Bryothamnion seaforthii]ARW63835.1 hypothetical protein [Bryothamnion seaforthii]